MVPAVGRPARLGRVRHAVSSIRVAVQSPRDERASPAVIPNAAPASAIVIPKRSASGGRNLPLPLETVLCAGVLDSSSSDSSE